jgi:hypothetical protein
MALSYLTTNVVTVPAASSVNNCLDSGGTILMWLYPTDIVTANSYARNANIFFNNNGGSSVQLSIARATQSILMVSNGAPSTLGANKWFFVAAVWNPAGTNTDQHLYHGDLATAIAEVSSYSIQRVGSGTVTSNSGLNLLVGNATNGLLPMTGRIGVVAMWNRQLSLGELRAQQYRPLPTSGCVLFTHLGFNGTGTQPDWSGNGNNASVSGCTVADHVPLRAPFGGAVRGAYRVLHTTAVSLSATSANAAVMTRRVQRSLAGAAHSVAALARRAGKPVSASGNHVSTLARAVVRSLARTSGHASVMARSGVRTFAAACASARGFARRVGKPERGSSSGTGRLVRLAELVLGTSSVGQRRLVRLAQLVLATSSAGNPTLSLIRALVFIATSTAVAGIRRSVGAVRRGSSVCTAVLRRALGGRVFVATSAGARVLRRQLARTPAASAGHTEILHRGLSRNLAAASGHAVALSRSVRRLLQTIGHGICNLLGLPQATLTPVLIFDVVAEPRIFDVMETRIFDVAAETRVFDVQEA